MSTTPKDAGDERLMFDDDDRDAEADQRPPAPPWKLLIVDDDAEVHSVTKMALNSFSFMERRLQFIHAYSGSEACEVLKANPDIAVVLLDVVMESNDAGLRAVRKIREELGNKLVRIIVRTGQPGLAPEREVTLNYDINDYKAKAELTAQKLYVSLVAALRSYNDLQTIESNRRGLVKILDAASSMDFRSRSLFASGLLQQLAALLEVGEQDLLLLRQDEDGGGCSIMAAAGNFDAFAGEPVDQVLDPALVARIMALFADGVPAREGRYSLRRIELAELPPVVLMLGGSRQISEAELLLAAMFCRKIVQASENFDALEQGRQDQEGALSLLGLLGSQASYLDARYLAHRGQLCRDLALQMQADGVAMDRRLPALIQGASQLADIGNAKLSAELLEQATPLSELQRRQQREHVRIGATLIEDMLAVRPEARLLKLARELALHHHERPDGSGYPQGLGAADIPLAARILAVADGYMALSSARPWRAAFGHEAALAELQQQSGSGYDPQVLQALQAVAEQYRPGS
ncbi:DUF3369 domain-containing protein [Pelomonas sp. SE-A7]|uniref:HD domain-containing phosphohydrolase n=1 Tax=Pelomonas sp. SE-A7 TaxID=3054953 RepID=UPI00259CAD55|nr:DUF3369 domain-containing protein [Pelomonas sp. SE-A7]MDM4766761.1 DUF3369 domain-containing protein [Pelomonas sp. SE-A7]